MSASISGQNEMAKSFVQECIIGRSEDKLKAMVSKHFSGKSEWNYGKKVEWNTFDQMVGAYKLAIWNNQCSELNVEIIKDGVIRTTHVEKPNTLNSETVYKLDNLWSFAFACEGDETKIDSFHVACNVESL